MIITASSKMCQCIEGFFEGFFEGNINCESIIEMVFIYF
jgi:hypothetical protein